jgi:hypothetical protein
MTLIRLPEPSLMSAPSEPVQRWSLLKASEPERARFATLVMAALLVITHAVFLLSLPPVVWQDARSALPHYTFGPPVLAVLVYCLWRRTMPLRTSRGLFVALVLFALPNVMLLDVVMSTQGRAWTPLIGERTVLLALGLLSPLSMAASVALVLLYVVVSGVHWVVQLRALQPLASWTPWVTVAWGVMAYLLMLYRRSVNAALTDAADSRAELETVRSAARTLLVMRDGVNTPLQTLALGLAMLERNPQLTPQLLPRLQRAHAQLRELMRHSAEVEDPQRRWNADELSPDPHRELERLRTRLEQLERGEHLH